LKMSLLTHKSMRSGVCVKRQSLTKQLEEAFRVAKQCLNSFDPKMMAVPKALEVPRALTVDVDMKSKPIEIPKLLRRNPLFVI